MFLNARKSWAFVLASAWLVVPSSLRSQEKLPTEDPQVAEYFKTKKWKVRLVPMPDGTKAAQLDTANQALTDDDFKVIGKSKSVQLISFSAREVTDEAYKAIGGMGQLEYLFIFGGGMTDSGLNAVANCAKLKMLSGSASEVTDEGLKPLGGLKNLTKLRLVGGGFTGTGFAAFAEAKELKELQLALCNQLTDDGAKAIAGLPSLQSLEMDGSSKQLTSAGIAAIAAKRLPPKFRFPNSLLDDELFADLVKKGWLYGPGSPDTDKPATADKLKQIDISRSKVTDKGMKAVADCANVEYLFADNSGIGDGTLKQFAAHKKLKYLILEETKVTAAGLEELAVCPLEKLTIYRTDLSDDMCKAVGKIAALKELTLTNSKLGATGAKHFATLPNLKELTFAYTDFTDDSAKALAGQPALQVICVNYTELTDAGFQELLKLPKLKSIEMYGTKVKKETIEKAKKDYPKLSISS